MRFPQCWNNHLDNPHRTNHLEFVIFFKVGRFDSFKWLEVNASGAVYHSRYFSWEEISRNITQDIEMMELNVWVGNSRRSFIERRYHMFTRCCELLSQFLPNTAGTSNDYVIFSCYNESLIAITVDPEISSPVKGGVCRRMLKSMIAFCVIRLVPFRGLVQNFCFFTPFNASKKPAANNSVMSPAKYGIISVIFAVVDKFQINTKSEDRRYPQANEYCVGRLPLEIEDLRKNEREECRDK